MKDNLWGRYRYDTRVLGSVTNFGYFFVDEGISADFVEFLDSWPE